ncbi:MAG: LEA type 2 family protein [Bacteroidia bacterium]|nr:LEA type 2 family protein [Bacteroidia bacterium]
MKVYSQILIFFFLILSACNFQYPEVRQLREIKLKGYNPLTQELKLSYTPKVHNPNSFDIWVDAIDTEIIFDGISLGSTHSEKRIDLPAGQATEFSLDQKIKVQNFIQQLKGIMKKDSIKIELDGKYSFKASDYEVKVPYIYETYLSPKKDLAKLLLGL